MGFFKVVGYAAAVIVTVEIVDSIKKYHKRRAGLNELEHLATEIKRGETPLSVLYGKIDQIERDFDLYASDTIKYRKMIYNV